MLDGNPDGVIGAGSGIEHYEPMGRRMQDSPTYGRQAAFRLDDVDFAHLYVPPGFLHGFQALTETADVCYRIDAPHDPTEDIAVRYDDPDLAIDWPLPVSIISDRDAAAGSFAALR